MNLVESVLKLCRRCGEKKPRRDFHTQRRGVQVERLVQMYCKPCMNAYRRETYDGARTRERRRLRQFHVACSEIKRPAAIPKALELLKDLAFQRRNLSGVETYEARRVHKSMGVSCQKQNVGV